MRNNNTRLPLVCPQCDKSFTPKYGNYKAGGQCCSQSCAAKHRQRPRYQVPTIICQHCRQSFVAHNARRRYTPRFCSLQCLGLSRRQEKVAQSEGYVYVRDEDGNEILEHRLVVERRLGRKLQPDEHVHHVNKVRPDNRDENLVVMKNGDHSRMHRLEYWEGRRLGDRWSREYDACQSCGTTRVRYGARGLCKTCYSRRRLSQTL